MMIGFQDDPSLRWRDDRSASSTSPSRRTPESSRTTVYWSRIAETKPANGANPFDPAYRFDDLDEFVRNAGLHGMEVMLTIWGTPSWANGGKGQNYAPTNYADLQNFAQGARLPVLGPVQRLPVRPVLHGLERVEPRASSCRRSTTRRASPSRRRSTRSSSVRPTAGSRPATRGRSSVSARPPPVAATATSGKQGTQETESPGKFAELLSQQKPLFKFDAWSHHPYPTSINGKPIANVRWPNVTLAQMPRFEKSARTWFKRKNLPVWITEYGHETKPEEPKGVTYAQQAAYVKQAMQLSSPGPERHDVHLVHRPRRSDERLAERARPARRREEARLLQLPVRREASTTDATHRSSSRAAPTNPVVKFAALELWSRSGAGAKVGMTIAIYDRGKVIKTAQPRLGDRRRRLGLVPRPRSRR